MDPIRIRVTQIIDFGTIVSVTGTDMASERSVAIHIDHRPFKTIWETWQAAGYEHPIMFAAESLTLDLSLIPEGAEADGAA